MGAYEEAGYRPSLQFHADVEAYFLKVFGVQHFTAISQALTCPSNYACIRINTLRTTTEEVIAKLLNLFKDTDIARTGHGSSFQFDRISSSSDLCYEHSLLKDVIIVQGDGPHQITYAGDHGLMKEVVVSRKCAEAILRGANVFVPGVLACSGHVEEGDVVAVCVALEHLDDSGNWVVGVTRGTTLNSEHGNAQFKDKERRNCYIGKGKVVLSRTAMFRELQGLAVEMVERVFNLPPLHGILKGDIFLQNLPSIVAARVLDPQPADRILDMCAAPGGKTTAMAMLLKDKGTIIALDRSHNKVMDIRKLVEEMRLTCVRAYKIDALKAVQVEANHLDNSRIKDLVLNGEVSQSVAEAELQPMSELDSFPKGEGTNGNDFDAAAVSSVMANSTQGKYQSNAKARKEARKLRNGPPGVRKLGSDDNQIKGFLAHSFDKVLLDPPCSALGLRPRLFAGEETIEGLRRHAIYQKRLLDQAVQLCAPGGTIVYSTCTINPGENEAVVRYALDTYPRLFLVPQNPSLGGPGLTGELHDGVSCKQLLREEEKHLVQRFDPSGPLDTIGFFIAKFQVKRS